MADANIPDLSKLKIDMGDKKIKIGIAVIIVIVLLVVGLSSTIRSIPAGHKGVIVSGLGEIGGQFDEGVRFVGIFVTIELVRYNTQGIEETISILTNDEVNVPVDFQITYHLQESKVGEIHTKNPDYQDVIIRTLLRSEARKTAADLNLTSEDINKKRTVFESQIQSRCISKMGLKFIIVESVNIRNVDLPRQILDASEKRAASKIDIETAKYELEAERARAQKEQIKAAAESNATIILAQGQAESIKILSEVSGDMSIEMMDYILSLRYIAALRDPNSNVQFVIVPEDGPSLILDLDGLQAEANQTR